VYNLVTDFEVLSFFVTSSKSASHVFGTIRTALFELELSRTVKRLFTEGFGLSLTMAVTVGFGSSTLGLVGAGFGLGASVFGSGLGASGLVTRGPVTRGVVLPVFGLKC
jgi:hypothetical protein